VPVLRTTKANLAARLIAVMCNPLDKR